MRKLKNMLQLNTSSCLHNDLQETRISRDESDVKSLLSTLDSWINPFTIEKQDLVCLSTGKMANEQIEKDLEADDIVERAYRCFSRQRLESNPAKEKCFDAMKKVNLKTFAHLSRKREVQKGSTNEIVVRADRRLFAQMIVIAEKRKLTMSSVLSHPLGPPPWALASPDGSLRKTNKNTPERYTIG